MGLDNQANVKQRPVFGQSRLIVYNRKTMLTCCSASDCWSKYDPIPLKDDMVLSWCGVLEGQQRTSSVAMSYTREYRPLSFEDESVICRHWRCWRPIQCPWPAPFWRCDGGTLLVLSLPNRQTKKCRSTYIRFTKQAYLVLDHCAVCEVSNSRLPGGRNAWDEYRPAGKRGDNDDHCR